MVSDLDVQTDIEDSIAIIRLTGQVDLTNSYQLKEAIDDQLHQGMIKLIVDTRKLNFIDSSCLGILISSLRKVKESDGSMVLVVNQYVERLITVTGLGSIFSIENDPERAKELLKS
jgi:anti-sigma B factor antagonist